jgi:D-lactate dehydrogenase (cytochrome)
MPKNLDKEELKKLLPNKITFELDELQRHSNYSYYLSNFLPDAVYYSETEEDVIQIVNLCLEKKIPLIPYGSGTSVEGHTAAIHGGICLDMSKMNKVIDFCPEDLYVTVQPGISYNELNKYLESFDFHFPVEAGWGASIGGMTATNASGAGATDTGSMAKNVLSCDIIVYKNNKACKITTGTKSLKSSAGYNLNNLFIGSEGTLGVFTKITLRIRKNFYKSCTICCQFDEIKEAIEFITSIKGQVQFRRAELMDKLQTEVSANYSSIDFLNKNLNTIIIELAGNEQILKEEVQIIKNYLQDKPVTNFKMFNTKQQSEKLWMMRKNARPAAIQIINKNKKAINTDVSVPLSKLAECIAASYKHMEQAGIKAPLVAHVGDGNFHFTVLVDPEDENEMQIVKEFNEKIVSEALNLSGSCTGEHGIGVGKIASLEKEHGDIIFLMKTIKKAIDPYEIFNPGKIISNFRI